ncbi:MAG: GDSL-type esterase/lipase family protein [Nodosilinea sp.]
MDVWLLAAQLMFSGAAQSPAGLSAGGTNDAIAELPPAVPDETLQTAHKDLRSERMAAVAPATVQPAPSMGSTVNRWPSPSQVITPSYRAAPPLDNAYLKPVTGSQLYQFRTAALAAGEIYTQAQPQQYVNQWQRAFASPTHDDWQELLTAEALAMARRQGQASLAVMVGDSLALWLPVDQLAPGQLWLNQSISGETTAHMLQRLHYFANTRPDTVYIMAGINDLKAGVPEAEVLDNLYQMMTRLKQQHPQVQLVVYSILPTRLRGLSSDRIQHVNQRLASLASYHDATFVDLHTAFSDSQGLLRPDLTTDGLHLSPQGYSLWQASLVRAD